MIPDNGFTEFTSEVITRSKKNTLQVVFVTAEWCGSCVIIEHIVRKLQLSYSPEILFYKADYDRFKTWANRYGIFAPPALLYAWNREVIEKDEGTVSGQEVVRKLDAIMKQFTN